tara:strand:- start:576 stop:833 length:258 start_codon:yes stop_codon:yes gene_type:complete
MSLEVHKYIETSLEKKENLLNAKVINFPNEKSPEKNQNSEIANSVTWKLYDKSNAYEDGDQLKAVIGICFMLSVLILLGLYSNLI